MAETSFQPLTKEQYLKARNQGFSPEKIIEFEKRRKAESQPLVKTGLSNAFGGTVPAKETFLTKKGASFPMVEGGKETILPNVTRTFGNIPSSARDLTRGVIEGTLVQGAKSLGQIPGAVKGLVKDAGGVNNARLAIGHGVESTLGKGGEFLKGALDSVKEKGVAQTVSDVVEKGIEDPLLIPSLVYAPSKVRGTGVVDDTISRIASPITRGADTRLSTSVSKLVTKSEAQIERAVLNNFEKGIKPLLPGKSTLRQADQYKKHVVDAIESIVDNKPNLSFVDDIGETVTGRTPESIREFAEALDQTKASIYRQYDDIARQAGEEGLMIEPLGIADELDTVITNKSLQLTNPKAIRYAEELKERLIATGAIDSKTAQEVIQNYNKSLEAFYRNPTYDTASQAAIDALVVNRFRKALDEGIAGLTGAEYQALKNKYSSLKTIERDVVKAALRDARKNQKGLIDFTDILTGGDIVGGLISLSPGQVARGVVGRGVKEFYKYLNDPNRAIERMFRAIENQRNPIIRNTVLPTAGTRLQTQANTSSEITPNTNPISS